jgi:hypothetical protein
MRFSAFILAAAMSRTVTGSSAVSEREKHGLYVSHIAQIHTMCPRLKGENISKVLSGYFSELTNQVALVPDLGGEQWKNEVCFYLGHNQDDKSTRIKTRSLLLSLMNRLIDISAKETLYSDYLKSLRDDVARQGLDLHKANERYESICRDPRKFIPKLVVDDFSKMPRQARSAIYFAAYGLVHPGKPLSEKENRAACFEMRNMMVVAWNAVDRTYSNAENSVGYYLMVIQYADKVLKLVHRPMPPLLNKNSMY